MSRRRNMNTRTLIAGAVVAAFSLVSIPAMANDVFINQWGFGHAAGGVQTGWNNTIGVHQYGWWNSSTSEQYGNNNTSAVGQDGWNNDAQTWQNGNNNAAGVGQF